MRNCIKLKWLNIIMRKNMKFKRKYAFSDVEFIGVACILLQLYGAITVGGIFLVGKAIIGFF